MENKQGFIDNHNIRGKHKGEGFGIERGFSGLEGETNRGKGGTNSGEIHGKIFNYSQTDSYRRETILL